MRKLAMLVAVVVAVSFAACQAKKSEPAIGETTPPPPPVAVVPAPEAPVAPVAPPSTN